MQKSTLCMLVKMLKIMDGPLAIMNEVYVAYGSQPKGRHIMKHHGCKARVRISEFSLM